MTPFEAKRLEMKAEFDKANAEFEQAFAASKTVVKWTLAGWLVFAGLSLALSVATLGVIVWGIGAACGKW